MMRRALVMVAAAAASAVLAADNAPAVVAIDGTRYEPATLTVKVGQRVTWKNRDPFPHTVTAKGAFDSHDIRAGGSWSFVPRKPGRWDYICTLHPNMKGTLIAVGN